jgi:hypothetical protein
LPVGFKGVGLGFNIWNIAVILFLGSGVRMVDLFSYSICT